jgi:hypothetical protein
VGDVVGADAPAGPEQATTGKATATSPVSGLAVVVVEGGTVVTVVSLGAVVPTSAEAPHPVRQAAARTVDATAARLRAPPPATRPARDDLHMTAFDVKPTWSTDGSNWHLRTRQDRLT